jgi:(p)ppGpp synthase/HD superfamily hydrolase
MTDRLEQARQTSEYAHALQTRKGSNEPYSVHPHAVAAIASQYTDDEDTLVAAEFHDILEDVPADRYSEDRMRKEFGANVVNIVKMVSEDKRADDEIQESWENRKLGYINHLRQLTDREALIISAADKIHNIDSMLKDYETLGEELWTRFNAPKEKQLWNYQSILGVLSEKDLPEKLIEALRQRVNELAYIISLQNSAANVMETKN